MVILMTPTPHINIAVLAHAVDTLCAQGWTKADVAREAMLTPSNLGEYLSGKRNGETIEVRRRLAKALRVPVVSLTCWCPRPDGRCMTGGDL
jgi:predicted transcriptional regulator